MFYHTLPLHYIALKIFNHRRDKIPTKIKHNVSGTSTWGATSGESATRWSSSTPSYTACIRIGTRKRQLTLGLQQDITYQNLLQGGHSTRTQIPQQIIQLTNLHEERSEPSQELWMGQHTQHHRFLREYKKFSLQLRTTYHRRSKDAVTKPMD